MRVPLLTGVVEVKLLLLAFGLSLAYLVAAAAFFAWMLGRVREEGLPREVGLE
jgi:hypothetical protein